MPLSVILSILLAIAAANHHRLLWKLPIAALLALIVLHGWDLARATGQPFHVDENLLQVVHGFVSSIGPDDRDGSLFGPAVEVGPDAGLLDRVLGLSGRDPEWSLS